MNQNVVVRAQKRDSDASIQYLLVSTKTKRVVGAYLPMAERLQDPTLIGHKSFYKELDAMLVNLQMALVTCLDGMIPELAVA